MSALAPLLETFLTERLIGQRQASHHTVVSHQGALCLLLRFAKRRTRRAPHQLALEIGHPIENLRVYLPGDDGSLAPVSVSEEMCIAGEGLVRRYFNQPGSTAQRFVADPYSPDGRLYGTGDFARRLPHETLGFLGRIDHQGKIGGSRIEPGEIEAVLSGRRGIRSCLALHVEQTRPRASRPVRAPTETQLLLVSFCND